MSAASLDSLIWIKTELERTLDTARHRLDAYSEEPDKQSLFDEFIALIHQVAGTFVVLEVRGGHMLAEHTEALAQAVRGGRVQADTGVFELLMRACLELSDYLERMVSGMPDSPAVLIAAINEIRVRLGDEPLEQERVGKRRRLPLPEQPSGEDLVRLAAQLRPRYQAALLDYYRGRNREQAIANLRATVAKLEAAATTPPVFEFLWVTGGLLEALADNALAPSLAINRTLGQFERELKRLATTSEAAVAETPPESLTTRMVAELERSAPAGERVMAIREAFRSNEAEGSGDQAAVARPGSALLASAAGAVLEDLARVRDRIDIFVRTGCRNPADLAPLAGMLKKVGDALGMLGLELAREHVAHECSAIRALAEKEATDETALLSLATGLITVESDVEAWLAGSGDGPGAQAERGARLASLREALADISRLKDAFNEYLRVADASALRELPRLAARLANTLDFLALEQAATPIRRIGAYAERVQAGSEPPARADLDRLADAVVSVEYFLDTLRLGREGPASMLENADRALQALGIGESAAPSAAVGEAAPFAARMAEEQSAAGGEIPTLAAAPVVEPAIAAQALPPVREPGADPEIVAVFMDEGAEVLAALERCWPAWEADPADRDALATIRRSFHTLKGSGRMVGARRLGEFAWAYENLLNRVIDYTLPPTEAIVAAVGAAIGAAGELLRQFDRDVEPVVNVQELFDRAWVLVRAETLVAGGEETAADRAAAEAATSAADVEMPDSIPTAESGAVPESPAPASEPTPRLDPVLYGIYRRETEGHLGVVQAWFDGFATGAPARVSRELERAVHTLDGSAGMAGVGEISEIFAPLARGLERIGEDQTDPTGLLAERLGAALTMGGAILEAYADRDCALPDWQAVAADMTDFADRVEAAARATATEMQREMESAAATSAATPSKRVDLHAQAGYDAELAQVFVAEANELLDGADAAAHAWSRDHALVEPLTELLRRLHTLKGGARMTGITPLADLTHELESLLTRVSEGRTAVSDALLGMVERSLDRLHQMLSHVAGDGMVPLDAEMIAALHAYASDQVALEAPQQPQTPAEDTSATLPGEIEAEEEEEEASLEEFDEFAAQDVESGPVEEEGVAAQAVAAPGAERPATPRLRHEMARVRADLLETSINNTGEVSIYRGRIEQQLGNMNVHLAELDRTVDRLREQLRELEIETEAQILSNYEQSPETSARDFDPLEFDRYTRIHELSRSLAEAVSDLSSLRSLFATELRQADVLLERQGRVSAELQDALMRTRMVPFSLSAPRLRRMVRQVAEEAGKQIDFDISGGDGEMDRQVVGHILPALEHLLRNAVVHGIEAPGLRAARGKSETGQVSLTLRRDGGDMIIEVSDDGGGLDLEAIRAKAVAERLVAPDAELSEADIIAFVYRPGFTTSTSVTQAAGRGVGMDVVAAEARQIGGSTEIETTALKGARCRMRLPATLAITQILLVKIGCTRYPVALASITGIARLPRTELQRLLGEDSPSYEYGGEAYELVSLAALLGEELPPADEQAARQPLLLVNAGGRRLALIAEDMEGSREIVVKPVGPQVAGIPGIAGATVFGDGSIGLLFDLSSLVRGLPQDAAEAAQEEAVATVEPRQSVPEPLVMVVDDSITVRRVTQRLLERNGARVLTAKDGVEALELLQDNRPDAMLLDIEMPRMDGYELAGHMQNDERLRRIPIIVITSRTGDKHRARAKQIGIEHYLGKPYRDTELIEAVRNVSPAFAGAIARGGVE